MPFENADRETEQRYLSDGIAGSLIEIRCPRRLQPATALSFILSSANFLWGSARLLTALANDANLVIVKRVMHLGRINTGHMARDAVFRADRAGAT